MNIMPFGTSVTLLVEQGSYARLQESQMGYYRSLEAGKGWNSHFNGEEREEAQRLGSDTKCNGGADRNAKRKIALNCETDKIYSAFAQSDRLIWDMSVVDNCIIPSNSVRVLYVVADTTPVLHRNSSPCIFFV